MRAKDRDMAVRLRGQGFSEGQIARELGATKNSVHKVLRERAGGPRQVWTGVLARTLGLTPAEVDRLSKRAGRFTGSSRLPDAHGFYVYFLVAENDSVIYIGQSQNLYARLGAHMSTAKADSVHHIEYFQCESKEHMDRVERILIQTVHPPLNVIHQDGDRDPYLTTE